MNEFDLNGFDGKEKPVRRKKTPHRYRRNPFIDAQAGVDRDGRGDEGGIDDNDDDLDGLLDRILILYIVSIQLIYHY